MHKSLSYFVYIRSNLKKALGMIISIALSIFLISVMQFYTANMTDTAGRGDTKFKYISIIDSTKGSIPKDILNGIAQNENVERLIQVNPHSYMINNIIGSDSDYKGYGLEEKDISYVMSKLGLKLKEGRLPHNNNREIVINENVARARSLKVGDYMGSSVSQYDYFAGKYKICGIIKGDNIISFIGIAGDEVKNMSNNGSTFLVIPKAGKLAKVNDYLETLPKSKFRFSNLSTAQNSRDEDSGSTNAVFNLVLIVMIIVLSVTLGNSAYVHYYQRRMEFGLLAAIGFDRKKIIFRAFKEICTSCFIGMTCGFFITYFFMIGMNKFYIYPHGLSPFSVSADLIVRIISIPIFICIFSLLPSSRLLSKIEPISIIERNE